MNVILAATELSAGGERAVANAWRLAAAHRAALHVIHVVPEDLPERVRRHLVPEAEAIARAQLDAARSAADGAGVPRAHVEIRSGRPFEGIVAYAEAVDAGLVVIGDHRWSPLRDIFMSATVERVLRTSERPILLARRPWPPLPGEILGATDFSVVSRQAIATAARLFPDARLSLVHVFDIPFSGHLSASGDRAHEAHFRALVAREMSGFVETLQLQGRRIEQALRTGPPAAAILEELERRQAGLLAVGTHGRVGLGRAVLGSVAEELIRRAPCDILAVRGW